MARTIGSTSTSPAASAARMATLAAAMTANGAPGRAIARGMEPSAASAPARRVAPAT